MNKTGIAPRIAGGSEVIDLEMPWVVAFYNNITFLGQGTLINDYYALTSPYVFIPVFPNGNVHGVANKNVTVVLGSVGREYWDPNVKGAAYPPDFKHMERLIPHPNYNLERDFEYAIALVKFSEAFSSYSTSILPICLPPDLYSYVNETGLAAGWGWPGTSGPAVPRLLKAEFQILPTEKCLQHYNDFNSTINLCAMDPKEVSSLCGLDTGAPLLFEHNDRQFVQVGIMSIPGDCDPQKPSVFTRVNNYLQWIDNNTLEAFYCENKNPFDDPRTMNCDCGIAWESRGRRRDPKNLEFPWQAQIEFGSNIIGTATLVNDRYVVTAASVFIYKDPSTGSITDYKVKYKDSSGFIYVGAQYPGVRHYFILGITGVILHPNYHPNVMYAHNIAVVQFANRVREYSNNILPICLPVVQPDYATLGTEVLTFQLEQRDKQIYRVLDLNLTDDTVCRHNYTANNKCIAGQIGRSDCIIEKGAGWFYRQNKYQLILIGLSLRSSCSGGKVEILGTDVFQYINWITFLTRDGFFCENRTP